MIAVGIVFGAILLFSLGFSLSWLIWSLRIKNAEYMKRAIANARLQGRLERGENNGSPRLTPPDPWKD